uniref:Claudin-10-like n=1 Tax=Gouania willdenowi TaxID=441366 RepID=A0A8C5IAB9_GOUWI
MRKRLIQVFGFLISSLGWFFILCTMAMDYWRISQIGGQGGSYIIKVAWYWSNLWKDCFTDSTAVTNCRDFPVLWSVAYYVQVVRGLLMCGLTLGFFAVVLCFVGMECTYIGGAVESKDKMVFAGAVFHVCGGEYMNVRRTGAFALQTTKMFCPRLVSLKLVHAGISDLAGYCVYINRVARTAFAPNIGPGVLRYDLGPPIFLGLVGTFLIYLGAVLYAVTVWRVICPQSKAVEVYGGKTYMAPYSRGRTLYTGYYRPSGQYESYYGSGRNNSSKISKLSQTTPTKLSDRDAFV